MIVFNIWWPMCHLFLFLLLIFFGIVALVIKINDIRRNMFRPKITYGYDDIGIVPAVTTEIEHRNECITKKNGMLPIFASPMSTVLNEKNADLFEENGIIPIIPRNVDLSLRNEIVKTGRWVAYSLNEFESFIEENDSLNNETKILIDVANGHMEKILRLSRNAKKKFGNGNLKLMSGNIANPDAYREYCRAGIDYVRVGIGGGCFHPDTLITTKKGLKKISDIKVGDEVITHKNRYMKVLNKKREKANDNMMLVNNVKCTNNHKFYVINVSDKESVNENNLSEYAYWVEAEKLNKETHLLIQI